MLLFFAFVIDVFAGWSSGGSSPRTAGLSNLACSIALSAC